MLLCKRQGLRHDCHDIWSDDTQFVKKMYNDITMSIIIHHIDVCMLIVPKCGNVMYCMVINLVMITNMIDQKGGCCCCWYLVVKSTWSNCIVSMGIGCWWVGCKLLVVKWIHIVGNNLSCCLQKVSDHCFVVDGMNNWLMGNCNVVVEESQIVMVVCCK